MLICKSSVARFLTRARVDELMRQAAGDDADILTTTFATAIQALGQYISAIHTTSTANNKHPQENEACENMLITLEASNRSLHDQPTSLLKLQVCSSIAAQETPGIIF